MKSAETETAAPVEAAIIDRGRGPEIKGSRITVYDVLSYLAAGMSFDEILDDFPYLTREDIQACLAYAAERERSRPRTGQAAGVALLCDWRRTGRGCWIPRVRVGRLSRSRRGRPPRR